MASRSWRAADLRGDGPRPASVLAVVRYARLGVEAAHIGESLMFFVVGLCLALSALALSGERFNTADAWIVAVLSGALAGLSWGLAHRTSMVGVARDLDQRLRHQGALITAFELERAEVETPMARLLLSRVTERLRYGEARRALLPTIVVPVVAPLAAATLLIVVLELVHGKPAPPKVDFEALSAGLVESMETAAIGARNASNEGDLDGGASRRLVDLYYRVRALGHRLTDPPEDPDAALSQIAEIAELDRELASLRPHVVQSPGLEEQVEKARNWLDAARMGLAEFTSDPGSNPPSKPPPASTAAGAGDAAAGEGDATEKSGEGGGNGGTGSSQSLTAETGDGTMSGSPDPRSAAGNEPGVAAPETGTTAGVWWSDQHDAIVQAWIESRRTAMSR